MPAVIDAPMWMHWRKAWLWLFMEAVVIAGTVLTMRNSDRWTEQLEAMGGQHCTEVTELECKKGGELSCWMGRLARMKNSGLVGWSAQHGWVLARAAEGRSHLQIRLCVRSCKQATWRGIPSPCSAPNPVVCSLTAVQRAC